MLRTVLLLQDIHHTQPCLPELHLVDVVCIGMLFYVLVAGRATLLQASVWRHLCGRSLTAECHVRGALEEGT